MRKSAVALMCMIIVGTNAHLGGQGQLVDITQYGNWVVPTYDNGLAWASSSGDEVAVMVTCHGNVIITFLDDRLFSDGTFVARWDGEPTMFIAPLSDDKRGITLISSDELSGIVIERLERHSAVTIAVHPLGPDDRVVDRISLRGSQRAIDSLSELPCTQ